MLIALPWALTACAGLTVGELRIAAPPPSLVAPCAGPTKLPARGLSQSEVETLWGRDRSSLRTCKGKHGAMVVRDAGLGAALNNRSSR